MCQKVCACEFRALLTPFYLTLAGRQTRRGDRQRRRESNDVRSFVRLSFSAHLACIEPDKKARDRILIRPTDSRR